MTKHVLPEGIPEAQGLSDPKNEHDTCAIGLITKSHRIVSGGLSILKNLEHRSAVGADPKAASTALRLPSDCVSW